MFDDIETSSNGAAICQDIRCERDTALTPLPQDETPDATALFDRHLRCLYANAAATSAFGASPDSLLGGTLHDVTRSLMDADAATRLIEEVVATGRPQSWETTVEGPLGDCRYVTSFRRIQAAGGAIDCVLVNRKDVTGLAAARYLADEAGAGYDDCPVAMAICCDGRFVYLNGAAMRLFGGREIAHVMAAPVMDVIHPDDRPDVLQDYQSVIEGQPLWRTCHRIVRLDQTVVSLDMTMIPTVYQGRPAVTIVVQDLPAGCFTALDTLTDSDSRFRSLFENAAVGLFRTLPTGELTMVNPAMAHMLGFDTAAELVAQAKSTGQAMWYANGYAIAAFVQEVVRSAGMCGHEAVWLMRDGTPVHVRVSASILRGSDGSVVAVEGVVEDITKLRLAAEAARGREERLRALVGTSTELVMMLDARGDILFAGPALPSVLGYQPEEFIGQSWFSWIHPDDVTPFCDSFTALEANPDVIFTTQARCRTHDRKWRYLEFSARNLLSIPEVNVIALAAHDITERREAEETLRQTEDRFQSAFDNAPIGMSLQDINGRFTRVNAAFCRILGYSEEQLLSMTFYDITHPDDLQDNLEHRKLVSEGKEKLYRNEKRYLSARGEWVWTSLSFTAVRDTAGAPLYFVTLVEDISERRHAEEALRESESLFRHLWNLSADGTRLMDEHGKVLMVNEAFCRLVGKSAEELIGQPYLVMYGSQYMKQITGVFEERLSRNAIEPYMDREMVFWDGRHLHMEVSNTVIGAEGQPRMVLSSFRDITERRRDQESLERYRVLSQHMNDIMLFLRPDGSIIEANNAAARAYGLTRDELAKASIRDIRVADTDGADPGWLRDAMERATVLEETHRHKDGKAFPVEVSLQSTLIGREHILLAVIRDITERATFVRELAHQALHDPLTELPNRALFLDRLNHALASASRHHTRVAVLFIDLDRFKMVNDSLGHMAGDQVLVATAGRLRSCIRNCDTAARFGGDEFTILLEDITTEGEAIRTAERIVRRVQTPIEIAGQEVIVSGSIGLAVSGANDSGDDLLREADAAMYEAKSTGRARFAVYARDMTIVGRERMQLETDLRRAIERREFEIYYQPIVLMDTRQTLGVEALARWQHPQFGLMPPDEFVPLQEQIGMMGPFTVWVLREAQKQCMRWHEQGMWLTMSVNLSVHNLHEDGFAQKVGRMLEESGITPSSLKLEITESAFMSNPAHAQSVLNDLAEMGVRLSIDDFGTGYSSFTYLKQMPIHEIKIDKSFVMGMDASDDDDAAIVRATIDLAHNLRKKVVAEGVETETIWNLLNLLGCDAAQGFYMGRPMPAEKLENWLLTSEFGLHQRTLP